MTTTNSTTQFKYFIVYLCNPSCTQRAEWVKYRTNSCCFGELERPVEHEGTGAKAERHTLCTEETVTEQTGLRGLVSGRDSTWRTGTREVLSSKDRPIKHQHWQEQGTETEESVCSHRHRWWRLGKGYEQRSKNWLRIQRLKT